MTERITKKERRADEILAAALRLDEANAVLPYPDNAYRALKDAGFITGGNTPQEQFNILKNYMAAVGILKGADDVISGDTLNQVSSFLKKQADLADDGKNNNSLRDNYNRLEKPWGQYAAVHVDSPASGEFLTTPSTPTGRKAIAPQKG